jgi:cellulose synthase/poly-beta-1,6-N-acetylglucosamine synthase-like glycosyltransferase
LGRGIIVMHKSSYGENVHLFFGWECLFILFFQGVGQNFIILFFGFLWNIFVEQEMMMIRKTPGIFAFCVSE